MPTAKRYKPIHFSIKELVPPEIANLPEDYLLGLFNEGLLICIDRLREALGARITINNWVSGGRFTLRGFRPKNCTVGAVNSAHKKGWALDFDVQGMTAEQVREYLRTHAAMFPEITRCELGVNWVHIDCTPRNGWTGIKFFNP